MWTRHPLSAVWFRGGGADDADDARSEMQMEDDETILRGEEGISSHGAVREPAPLCGVTGIPARCV